MFCTPFLGGQTEAYQMQVEDHADMPLKIVSARITTGPSDLKIYLQVENIGNLTVDAFSVILPDGPRRFLYTVAPGENMWFEESSTRADMKQTESMALGGQLSSWTVSVVDIHFGEDARAGRQAGVGLSIRLDLLAVVEPSSGVEVSLPAFSGYFLQESGTGPHPFHGRSVLRYAYTYVEIHNTSKELSREIQCRFEGAVGEGWKDVLEDGFVSTVAPGEKAVVSIEVPVEVLSGGMRRSFEKLRLVVTAAVRGEDQSGGASRLATGTANEGVTPCCSGVLTLVQQTQATADSPNETPALVNAGEVRYTEEARKDGIQGVVRLEALVGIDGVVKQVKIISHLPDGLDEEAIRAAKTTTFTPAMKNGQSVPLWQLIDVTFSLIKGKRLLQDRH
jgi:TonB family protein